MTLLQTDFLPNKSETFQALRFMLQDVGLQTGRVYAGDYKVTQHSTPNMTVDVAAGSAWIIGTTSTRQGIYHQVNDGLVTVGNFANSDPTNPRIDQVILAVNDSSIGGVSDTPQFAIVQGAPTAGATLDNRSGAVADATINTTYRNSWVRWADVLIPANSTSVVNANIRDRGPFARGVRRNVVATNRVGLTPEGFSKAYGVGYAMIDASLQDRVECVGNPLRLKFVNGAAGATGAAYVDFLPWVDGAQLLNQEGDNQPYVATNANQMAGVLMEHEFTPAAGSHLISVGWRVNASAGSTPTVTVLSRNDFKALLTIEEILKPNAANT